MLNESEAGPSHSQPQVAFPDRVPPIRSGPPPIQPTDEETVWKDIDPVLAHPKIFAFDYPIPAGEYKPRKIDWYQDKTLEQELQRGGSDLYDPQAKKESPRGEAWRRVRRERLAEMIRKGELTEERVLKVRELWLRNPEEITMKVKRPRKQPPPAATEKEDEGCCIQ